MRTTLELDEKLLETIERLTGVKGKGKAVNKALTEYARWRAIESLRALAGTIDLVDNWRELEELELQESDQRWVEHSDDRR